MTPAQLDDIKARNPVHAIARQWVKLRKGGIGHVGPCPMCSQNSESKTAGRFECNADRWVCAVCSDGGDVIELVRKHDGSSFEEACATLGGSDAVKATPATAKREGAKAYRSTPGAPTPEPPDLDIHRDYAGDPELRSAFIDGWRGAHKSEQAALKYREIERKRLFGFYQGAARLFNSPAIIYMRDIRGCDIPPLAKLRGHSSFPMFADGRENEPRLLHRGPAMLAPILNARGVFSGLHITWLDLSQPKGKARIIDPKTGDEMPAKKSRGTKAGGYIDLGYVGDAPGRRMFAGEGNETVARAYTALHRGGRLRAGDRFRGGIDLGNLSGKAVETIAHPTLKTPAGRAQRVPGPVPDLLSPAMPVPDDVDELILIADGDSDPFLTRNAMARTEARHARPGRIIRVIWPTPAD